MNICEFRSILEMLKNLIDIPHNESLSGMKCSNSLHYNDDNKRGFRVTIIVSPVKLISSKSCRKFVIVVGVEKRFWKAQWAWKHWHIIFSERWKLLSHTKLFSKIDAEQKNVSRDLLFFDRNYFNNNKCIFVRNLFVNKIIIHSARWFLPSWGHKF